MIRLLVGMGNIRNRELLQLVSRHVNVLRELYEEHDFLELTREELVVHE